MEDVGIDIRETVNGVSELRNPMQILQDLADKWENLSSVQQSAIQEALANKRQSNIFTALMENFNCADSAVPQYGREKCNRFHINYRCHGYFVYGECGRVLHCIE